MCAVIATGSLATPPIMLAAEKQFSYNDKFISRCLIFVSWESQFINTDEHQQALDLMKADSAKCVAEKATQRRSVASEEQQ